MIQKEFRALLPAWGACAVSMVAASGDIAALRPFGVPVYFIGAASLGALSIGHEYSYRTIGFLLSQPVSRQRVLLTKLAVLAVMLTALMTVASLTVSLGRGNEAFGRVFLWLPVLAALFITPWLTMASHSPVAGTVFTVSIAGIVLVAGEWLGVSRYGFTAQVDTFRIAFLWWTMIGLCGVGSVMTWWTFFRLQAVDGRGTEVDLAPRADVAPDRLTRRSAGWLLVRKELRIQQLAFAVAAVNVVVYVGIVLKTRGTSSGDDILLILTTIYAGLLAAVIGSLASAEERNMRTLDAQLLLPMQSSRQWSIKAGVAIALTLLLALALPAALFMVLPPEELLGARWDRPDQAIPIIIVLVAMTSLSLYVSTLCSSGLWALLWSAPAAFATAVFVKTLSEIMQGLLYSLHGRPDSRIVDWATGLLTVAVIAVVLRLALANHRSTDRGPWRTATQVAILAFVMTAAVTVVGLAGALSR